MTVLAAQSIRKLCREQGMIEPFNERAVVEGKSFGLSAASYDLRIDQTLTLWPLWGRLASTVERLRIPSNVGGSVKNKSSWARVMCQCDNTWIDPGFEGWLTLELTRHKPWPVTICEGTPIVQLVFWWLDEPTEAPYRGKYAGQARGPQPAKHEAAAWRSP